MRRCEISRVDGINGLGWTLLTALLLAGCERDGTGPRPAPTPVRKPDMVLLAPGTVAQVSAGGDNTCALRTNGTVACWGDSNSGQATPPAGSFTQVSAGGSHTCARQTDATVACWGDNRYGQATPPAGGFTQVSAGGAHTCGLKTDGTVAC